MNTKHLLLSLLALLGSTTLHAYDAYIGGIYYNFNASTGKATVTSGSNKYTGSITIPATVTYNETTYSVTSIGDGAFDLCRDLTSISIPNSVTIIDEEAFYGCTGLTSIIIPNSVTTIERYAFDNCTNLADITFSNNLSYIGYDDGEYAFERTAWYNNQPNGMVYAGNVAYQYKGSMPANTNITLRDGTLGIGEGAFEYCNNLSSITIPNSVKVIGDYAFYGCSGLTTVIVKNSTPLGLGKNDFTNRANATLYVPIGSKSAYQAARYWNEFKEIVESNIIFADSNIKGLCVDNWDTNYDRELSGTEAAAVSNLGTVFKQNSTITSFNELKYFTGLSSIGNEAFKYCFQLTSVIIPENVSSIGNNAFQSCTKLSSANIPEGVTSIGEEAFYNTALTSIVIPEGVETISTSTFSNCRNLADVTLPSTLKAINDRAFNLCNISSITLPNGLLSIGEDAFYSNGFTSITIPESVVTISEGAFQNCDNLTSVTCLIQTPLSISSSTFSNRTNATLYVPAGSKSAYQLADYWNEFNEIVELPVDVTIGSTGYATFCSTHDLDFSEVSGLKAYIASGFSPSTGKLVLTRVDEVPAGEGLYLVGDEGTYTVPFATTDMLYSNFLKGVTTATTIYPTEGSYTNFILSNGSYGVGFYTLSASGELAAGKAYLQLPTASVSNVKAISLAFDDDDPTALQEIEDYTTAKDIYNLQGQKVSAPRCGLYIINGKKVAIK